MLLANLFMLAPVLSHTTGLVVNADCTRWQRQYYDIDSMTADIMRVASRMLSLYICQ